MGKETTALAGFVLVILAASLALALACLAIIKFSKHFIVGSTVAEIVKKCVLYSLGFTLAIGFASFLHMLFLHSSNYSNLSPQRETTAVAGTIIRVLAWPAFFFFVNLALSFFWASKASELFSNRRLTRAILTPLGLSLIFAACSFAYLMSMGYIEGSFFPADFVGYYIQTLHRGVEAITLLLSDYRVGWQALWDMFDVRGNFFNLSEVFSLLFVAVALATGVTTLAGGLTNGGTTDNG